MKTETTRDKLVSALSELSALYPSMRCGQILEMLATLTGATTSAEVGHAADAAILRVATAHAAERSRQLGSDAVSLDSLGAERRQLLAALKKKQQGRFFVPAPLAGALLRIASDRNTTLYDIEDVELLEAARWRCPLCGRSEIEIGMNHPLPIRQEAHFIPNRLSALKPRYNGVKNRLTEDEWRVLIGALGSDLEIPPEAELDEAKRLAGKKSVYLCGECHEEVLSEPIYLPAVLQKLAHYFHGKSRVEKILLLTRVIQLGVDALGNNGHANHS